MVNVMLCESYLNKNNKLKKKKELVSHLLRAKRWDYLGDGETRILHLEFPFTEGIKAHRQ